MASAEAGGGASGHRGSADPAPADRGLFGPGSVTWRIMDEPVMWVAGFRALYLQALHPRVMRGTWQNTAFLDRKQAMGRFIRTSQFVGVRTYGSIAQAERAARRIRKIRLAAGDGSRRYEVPAGRARTAALGALRRGRLLRRYRQAERHAGLAGRP
jgi:uncharacterized protein (DUF2236 family)